MWILAYLLAGAVIRAGGTGPHAPAGQAVDTAAVLSDLITEIRGEHPRLRVALDSQLVEHCTRQSCGAWPTVESRLPPGVATGLLRRGVVQELCTRARARLRCGSRKAMYLSVGPIHDRPYANEPGAGIWVLVTFYIPCGTDCGYDYHGFWYRLEQQAGGRWKVVDGRQSFAI